jgi:two-component sensor histidine kinase
MIELWGFDPAAGQPDFRTAMARFHPADRLRVRHELAEAHRNGWLRTEFRLIRPLDAPVGSAGAEPATGNATAPETVWLAARARLLPLPGQPDRMLGVAYDITERKLADERATLLSREVEHRAKNALAIVSGMLRMTVADNLDQFVDAVQARVDALARTLGLLAQQRWQGASLRAVAEEELEPFRHSAADANGVDANAVDANPQPGGPIVVLDGPEVHLPADAVQALSMALHELATNAVKHGALSVPEGRLVLRWTLEGEEVRLVWQERGGPTLAGPPARRSFGSEVIRQTIENQLGGRLEKRWAPEGLVCEIHFQRPAAGGAL